MTGSKPQAWFVEMGFTSAEDWSFAARYEEARDFQDDVFRYGASASYSLQESTALSVEYIHSDFDRPTASSAAQVLIQMALEF